jgi:hydrogenase nickel incorporation protein HypA/HybF
MHEYSLIQAMFDQIDRVTREHHAQSIRRVRVTIGEYAGVDPELFQTAYEVFRINTPCADAPLQITRVAGSEELLLDQLELEVP